MQLADYSLLDAPTRECPYHYFNALRREAPVHFLPEINSWYVSRYEDIRYVKKHPEIFSNDIYTYGSSRGAASDFVESYRAEHGWERAHTLQRTDPPRHTIYRKLISEAFSVKRIRTMTDYVETVVNDLLDRFIDKGECDFMWDFSIPLPCTVIADQLGVPRSDIWRLKEWSDAMLAPGGGYVDREGALASARLIVEAQKYFASVIEARRASPEDDIISDIALATVPIEENGGERPLTMNELLDLLEQLLTGGNETTTNSIGSGLMLLLQRPDTMTRVRESPKLLKNFVEETLRYESPVVHLWRVTTRETELAGVKLAKGARVALGYASANRDESVFADAETFDMERARVGAHLAFGSGVHHCPGAALARQEMFSAFTIILNRLDHIRLKDPSDTFEHVPHGFLRGLKHLNITFDVHRRDAYKPGASVYQPTRSP